MRSFILISNKAPCILVIFVQVFLNLVIWGVFESQTYWHLPGSVEITPSEQLNLTGKYC